VVSEHGAMEDIFLFNPAWWAKLPPSHREAIVQAVQLVRPEVERLKEQAQSDSLKVIRASGKVAVRIADETERKALREVMAPPARSAYLERGGEEGKRMLDLYNAESRRLGL
jgi:TRAP-type C4-dicarboxylate transport system substrate-binding protein